MADSIVKVGLASFVFKDGEFLLLHRVGSHGANSWGLPGGHIEFGESFAETAVRETLEETGVSIINSRVVGVTNDIFAAEQKHYVTVWVASDWLEGEPRIMEPNKCTEMQWTTFDGLPSELFTPIKNFLASDFFPKLQPLALKKPA